MGRTLVISLSVLFAIAVAIATYFFVTGLPPDTNIPLWASGPRWSLGRSLASWGIFLPSLVMFLLVIAGSLSVCLAFVQIWSGIGSLAEILLNFLVPGLNEGQQSRLRYGLQTLISLLLVVCIGSALLRTALAIQVLVITALGLAAVFAARHASYRMGEMRERLTLHSRSSPIGGGLTEWRISPPLAMILLAFALIGGTVAVATVGMRPETPPTMKPEAKTEAVRPAKPSDEISTETARAPGAASPAAGGPVSKPADPGAK